MATFSDQLMGHAKCMWAKMSDSEKAGVRFGMTPLWAAQELFRHRAPEDRHLAAESLALMACAEADGGMVA